MIELPENAESKGWGKDGGLEYSSSLGIPFITACMVSDQLPPVSIVEICRAIQLNA